MSTNLSFERQIAAWMADEAAMGVPTGAVDQALDVTGRLRPRPRWLALLRETPMTTQSRVLVGSPTRRIALVIAAIGLAIAAAVVGALLLTNTNAASDDWPFFRGGASRSGSGATGPVGHPTTLWTAHVDGVPSNIAIVGDAAYASTDSGSLTAFERSTGRVRWSVRADATGGFTGPAVDAGLVFVTDGDGTVVAVEAATGSRRWAAPAGLTGASTATAGGGMIYVAGRDGVIAALDEQTGAERWRRTIAQTAAHNIALSNGVVVLSADGGITVALDATSGAVKWQVPIAIDVPGTSVISGGRVFQGANNDGIGHLVVLDVASGSELWHDDRQLQSPAVADGVAYFTDNTGLVVALRVTDGSELWHLQLPALTGPAAVAQGVVYIETGTPGHLYAFDAATGGLRWELALDADAACCVAPSHGAVFMGTVTGTIYAIGGDGAPLTAEPRRDLASPQPTEAAAQPSPSGAPASLAPLPPTVSFAGTITVDDPSWKPLSMITDSLGRLWVCDCYNNRFSIHKADGTFVRFFGKGGSGPGELKLQRSNGDAYGNVAFTSDGTAYVLDTGNRRVEVFDRDGNFLRQWGEFGSGPSGFSEPVSLAIGPDDSIVVLDDALGLVKRFDGDGNLLKAFDAFPNARPGVNASNAMVTDAAGNIYVGQINPHQVTRFDPDGNVTMVYGRAGADLGEFLEQPGGLVVDDKGRLWINQGPRRGSQPAVYLFGVDGTLLGGFGAPGSGDMEIKWASGMAILDGKLYVGDVGDLDHPGAVALIKVFNILPPFAP